ncbi:STE/STE20/YSK protein kinase [Exophiala aquamarina CBS 119918]|uniref:non-specific serine/threonine protein kinase n=1 Tax=Exophiala aquamarina CBS 119918 TaxID=1182545 RepID=A0A072P3Y9_9EURO|nr:STE/STE20/YSK protein kinase [Exophiala aquamarina CBS 119918]KEF54794.1 STE/STE20/YSK protein kinase [Exophiala aquamarina CBS 119918]
MMTYTEGAPREARSTTSQAPFQIQHDEADGDTLADRYQVLEELGSGSFGVVYKAIEKATGEIVAIKHVDLESSEEDLSDILSELSVLSSCASPHVTKYRLAFLRRQTLWIVMEYLGGGSCADLLKPPPHCLSESHIAIICRELLLGLSYLHGEGKLHRDIKAANVLLGMDGRVKLADFGVAAQLVGLKSVRNTFVGTPFWMAPEVIQQEGHDAKADVWSLGITAMELANGEPPHANVHPMKVLFLIPKQSAPRLEGSQWSREFRDFVATCLTKDADKRSSAKELLKHRFIRSAGKIEGLQELIARKQDWEAGKGGERNLKYYAETLRNLPSIRHDDDWVFETVKAVPAVDYRSVQTQKRKRPSIDVQGNHSEGNPAQMMQNLALDHDRHPEHSPTTSTMRKISESKREQLASGEQSSVKQTAKKRVSSAQNRNPLGVNMSFGNSPSTVRQFRRVSPSALVDTNEENEDPCSKSSSRFSSTATTIAPESKEANLGRKLYANAIGISCQDVLNDTADEVKREAVARLAEAFSDLENVDPDGVYHIMSSIIKNMRGDGDLKKMLPSKHTPTKGNVGAKLLLAQNNPHLKSHRRRQSAQAAMDRSRDSSQKKRSAANEDAELEKEITNGFKSGLDHNRQLADVLFERWCEGLRMRWPAV